MKILCIPIHLDALVGEHAINTCISSNSFAAKESSEDYGCQSVQRPPFETTGFLPAGIHLHWQLPENLRSATSEADGLNFPHAPNRWLVTRRNASGIAEQSWIIESDYLYPSDIVAERSVAIPNPDFATEPQRPYRYLGRQVLASQWQEDLTEHQYLPAFTAAGWGPTEFSAFYAECFSCLGAFDGTLIGQQVAGYSYEVFGWYAQAENDFVSQHILPNLTDNNLSQLLADTGNFQLANNSEIPDISLCYGKIEFAAQISLDDDIDTSNTKLSYAKTVTEATSSWLSQHNATDAATMLRKENQLEAILLEENFQGDNIDFIDKLKKARHQNEFHAIDGGKQFCFIEASSLLEKIDIEQEQRQACFNSYDQFKQQQNVTLIDLNQLLTGIAQQQASLTSKLTLLYADWTKYVASSHHHDEHQLYPSPDAIKHQIESFTLPAINATELTIEHLTQQIQQKLQQLVNAYQIFTSNLALSGEFPQQPVFEVPAPRYWQPQDPHLVIAGDIVKKNIRHQPNPELIVQVIDIGEQTIHQWLTSSHWQQSLTWQDYAINLWQQQPWTPLFSQWQIQQFPETVSSAAITANLTNYHANFITDNYRIALNDNSYSLPSAAVDLQLKQQHQINLSEQANTINGRSLLPFSLEKVLTQHLKTYLDDDNDSSQDATQTISTALNIMEQTSFACLQLTDFHQQLLMADPNNILPINSPNRFTASGGVDSSLSEQVKEKLKDQYFITPAAQQRFMPIKNGVSKLSRLRIVDTFGRFKEINTDEVIRCQHAQIGNTTYSPPRLLQPSRLAFRWYNQQDEASQLHNPICGWINYNSFNDSLVIYNMQGEWLGQIDSDCQWTDMLGQAQSFSMINQTSLQRMVLKILSFSENNQVNYQSFMAASDNNHQLWTLLHQQKILTRIGEAMVEVIIPFNQDDWQSVEQTSLSYQALLDILANARIGQNNSLTAFTTPLQQAMDYIAPELTENVQLTTTSKPLAILEATIDLQLAGDGEINKSWPALNYDLSHAGRSDREFRQVKFPIKLGEFNNLDDGLVAYWTLSADPLPDQAWSSERLSEKACFPQSDVSDSQYIDAADFDPQQVNYIDQNESQGIANLTQSINDEPIKLLMLIDPEARVHATTGILPGQDLTLDANLYNNALANIQNNYFAAPLLTPNNKLSLPLPNDELWCWQQKRADNSISSTYSQPLVDQQAFIAQGESIEQWQALIQAKVLSPLKQLTDKAYYVETPVEQLPPSLAAQWSRLSQAINNASSEGISSATPIVPLTGKVKIIEGWLQPVKN